MSIFCFIFSIRYTTGIMQSRGYKIIELITLFVILPLALLLSEFLYVNIGLLIASFVYIGWYLVKVEKMKFRLERKHNWPLFWFETLVIFLVIVVLSSAYVYLTDPSSLFFGYENNFWIWLTVVAIYCISSVYPQEIAYRTFYFKRYESLFKNKYTFVIVNALLFALGHIFFRNTFVLIITFLGGMIFAANFYRTRSTLMVSIEHALYGSWLFTVGMGEMLGFIFLT
jgi:membrane protease YdiL (CAAX protease family)